MSDDDVQIFAEANYVPVPPRRKSSQEGFVRKVARTGEQGRPPEQATTMRQARTKAWRQAAHAENTTFDLGEGAEAEAAWLREHARVTGKKVSFVLLTLVRAYRARVEGSNVA